MPLAACHLATPEQTRARLFKWKPSTGSNGVSNRNLLANTNASTCVPKRGRYSNISFRLQNTKIRACTAFNRSQRDSPNIAPMRKFHNFQGSQIHHYATLKGGSNAAGFSQAQLLPRGIAGLLFCARRSRKEKRRRKCS